MPVLFPIENDSIIAKITHLILCCNRKMLCYKHISIADTHWQAFFYYGNEIAVIRNAMPMPRPTASAKG